MKKHVLTALCCSLMMLNVTALFAQGKVTGKLIDSDTNEALIGAAIYLKSNNSIGTVTNLDGGFELELPNREATLMFSYLGYLDLEKDVLVNGELDLGEIKLKTASVGIVEVSVVASIAKDRETPVAMSSIKPQLIEEKLGTQEYPEILKSTPSVYATKQGGGYGDSRIYLRGFDSNNIGVLINGVPVNDMESGKVYWSNWAGLSDVTQTMQVQRGLGASKLALSSVGGTINIITKSTDAVKGGSFYTGVGNDGYSKQALTFSTGLLENGWAVTASGSRTVGDGYIQATNFEGWSYFLNISKIINEKHRVSLTAFGAPQWHNQRGNQHLIEDYRAHREEDRWNSDFGYRNGKIYNGAYAYNYYHKPQISLNHYWNIDNNTMLATSVYLSKSQGGGRRIYGENDDWLKINYDDGRPTEETKLTPEGYLDFDYVINENANAENGSTAVVANSINSHDWYGILSTLTKNMGALTVTGGIDGRYYKGYHTYEIDDLLGGSYMLDDSNVNRDETTRLKVGDKVNYYNLGEVLWGGVFLQGEYKTDRYSAFLSVSGAQNSYRRTDYFQYTPEEGQVTDWLSFYTYTVKGGANLNINEKNNVFVNAGYITRAPYFRNAFLGYTNDFNEDAKNEKIMTGELGYGFRSSTLNVKANVYYTLWQDKGLVKSFGDLTANIPGINAQHYGVEIEAKYRPVRGLNIGAMLSVGDWRWTDNVKFEAYDEDQSLIGTFNAYIEDVHVGNSAQTTAWLGVDYEVLPKLKIGADLNFFGDNYSDFDPTNRTNPEDQVDAWQLPDATILDVNSNYKFKIGSLDATLYGRVHNLLNTEYITDATDGNKHDVHTATVYYGFGTTWSAGLKVKF
ncbi:TonB-dependent receptor [Carboxylicivirga sp. RSCT41]|uniref:TonB-dependent receptor n=1 Tax=Carboxylicivirga agarovorans TaxID=3417570 RepID=UPI003D33DFD0